MNDFTKEELQVIHEYLRGNPRTYVLAEKIQSMIDKLNCDHEYHAYGFGEFLHIHCYKCGDRQPMETT